MTEILARIELHTANLMGSGGRSEVSKEEILGAVGMIEDKFAEAMFLLRSNSSMAGQRECHRMLRDLQFDEWARREDAVLNAELAKQVALDFHGAERIRRTRDAVGMLEAAKAKRWPSWQRNLQRYTDIRTLALTELSGTSICMCCNGRGAVRAGALVIKCPRCAGTGRQSKTPSYRARCLGMALTSFLRKWMPIFDWTLDKCSRSAKAADDRFRENLG